MRDLTYHFQNGITLLPFWILGLHKGYGMKRCDVLQSGTIDNVVLCQDGEL